MNPTKSDTQIATQPISHAFSFGDPEPVLSSNPVDYLGTYLDIGGDYYRPPISLEGLGKIMDANGHHNSILHFKKNMVLRWFKPSKIISYNTLQSLALDFVVTGNMYPQVFRNAFKRPVRCGHLPAISMRRGKEAGKFFKLKNDGSHIEFKQAEVLHIKEPDFKQRIYGVPEYMGGVQSVLLSEEAGLFRRKYYENGAHMGYILVTNDANFDDETAKLIEKAVSESKGPGNFRSLYMNIAKSSSKEPVQIIPVGDIGTKDDFHRIKNITQNEILSMHRMQPVLSGIMPENVGGFGDIQKSLEAYHELEVIPLQKAFLELNDLLGVRDAVVFDDPEWIKNKTKAV